MDSRTGRLEQSEQPKAPGENARFANVLRDAWGPERRDEGTSSLAAKFQDQHLVDAGILPAAGDLLDMLMTAQKDSGTESGVEGGKMAQRATLMQAEGPPLFGDHGRNHVKPSDNQAVGHDKEGTRLGKLTHHAEEKEALNEAIRNVFKYSGGKDATKEYTAAVAFPAFQWMSHDYVATSTYAGSDTEIIADPRGALTEMGMADVKAFVHNHPDVGGRPYWLLSAEDCDLSRQYQAPEYIITPKGEILRWQNGDEFKKDVEGIMRGVPKHVGNIDKTGYIDWFSRPKELDEDYPRP